MGVGYHDINKNNTQGNNNACHLRKHCRAQMMQELEWKGCCNETVLLPPPIKLLIQIPIAGYYFCPLVPSAHLTRILFIPDTLVDVQQPVSLLQELMEFPFQLYLRSSQNN
ncbi:hypothetical protein J6590_018427 [Homalodisca vitripennis]|nr:hypothetical protein J6590_018427 [Homalodisca vitripennis]